MTYCIRLSIHKGGKIFKITVLVKKNYVNKMGTFEVFPTLSIFLYTVYHNFANEVLSYSINVHCTVYNPF